MYTPGTVIAGKYRVEGVLGRGGMGVVIAVEHIELRTRVALKFLAEKFVEHPHVTERFLREARACAQLRSEHICRVSDVGRLDSGVPYIVMELLAGRDLAKELRERVTLDVATAADYVYQACDAIAEAHAAQIIHRDLKPSNLFLTRRRDGSPLIKVLDFGVAKAQGENDFSLTSTDNVVGSPHYMSPEQLRSAKGADARSDIWSLGVILHELVSGKKPFTGETVVDLAVRISHELPERPTNAPPELTAIIGRCLQKDPSARYQHVGELAAALAPFAAGRGPSHPSVETITPMVVVPPPTIHTVDLQTLTQPAETTLRTSSGMIQSVTAPRTMRRSAILIGAVAAVTVVVGLVASRSDPSPDVQPTPPVVVPAVTAPIEIDAAVIPDAAPVLVVEPEVKVDAPPVVTPAGSKPDTNKRPVKRTKEQIGASRR